MIGPNYARHILPFSEREGAREAKRLAMMEIVDTLLDLEEASHPDTPDEIRTELINRSPTSDTQKDGMATNSLDLAGQLIADLAGWAINHTTGIVMGGVDPGVGPRENAERNKHLHEAWGEAIGPSEQSNWGFWQSVVGDEQLVVGDERTNYLDTRLFQEPSDWQRLLEVLGKHLLPEMLYANIKDDIERMTWGEDARLFVKEINTLKSNARRVWPYRIYAMEYMEYWKVAEDIPKSRSAKKIAKQYGLKGLNVVDRVTKTWPRQARKIFSAKRIIQMKTLVELAVLWMDDDDEVFAARMKRDNDHRFSDDMLASKGQGYIKEGTL